MGQDNVGSLTSYRRVACTGNAQYYSSHLMDIDCLVESGLGWCDPAGHLVTYQVTAGDT